MNRHVRSDIYMEVCDLSWRAADVVASLRHCAGEVLLLRLTCV